MFLPFNNIYFLCCIHNATDNQVFINQKIKAIDEMDLNTTIITESKIKSHSEVTEVKKTLNEELNFFFHQNIWNLIDHFSKIMYQRPSAEHRITSLFALYKILNIHNV